MEKLFIPILIILFGCSDSNSTISSNFEEEITLPFGQEVVLNGNELRIHFLDVQEDSRCPADAQCVWAGNGKIVLRVNNREIDLNTTLEPQEKSVSGYTMKLIMLSPYPELSKTIEKQDYTAVLSVERREK